MLEYKRDCLELSATLIWIATEDLSKAQEAFASPYLGLPLEVGRQFGLSDEAVRRAWSHLKAAICEGKVRAFGVRHTITMEENEYLRYYYRHEHGELEVIPKSRFALCDLIPDGIAPPEYSDMPDESDPSPYVHPRRLTYWTSVVVSVEDVSACFCSTNSIGSIVAKQPVAHRDRVGLDMSASSATSDDVHAAATEQSASTGQAAPMVRKQRRGRKPGSGSYEQQDAPLIEDMHALLAPQDGCPPQAASAEDAAHKVASRAFGNGTTESKIDRLARRYREKYGSKSARKESD